MRTHKRKENSKDRTEPKAKPEAQGRSGARSPAGSRPARPQDTETTGQRISGPGPNDLTRGLP